MIVGTGQDGTGRVRTTRNGSRLLKTGHVRRDGSGRVVSGQYGTRPATTGQDGLRRNGSVRDESGQV